MNNFIDYFSINWYFTFNRKSKVRSWKYGQVIVDLEFQIRYTVNIILKINMFCFHLVSLFEVS